MSEKHSLASRARMAKLSPDELFTRMSNTAHSRWSKMSLEERKRVGAKLLAARRKKKVMHSV